MLIPPEDMRNAETPQKNRRWNIFDGETNEPENNHSRRNCKRRGYADRMHLEPIQIIPKMKY
jgi:hypothetical protein